MKNKKAIAMSFNWIFAIIVGAVILFLAIYATMKIMGTGGYQINTETAAKITTLLDPMGTGLASGKSATLNFKKETRIYIDCQPFGQFGKDTISFSEKTFGDWGEPGGEIDTQKYVFGDKVIEGKSLSLFSKPFSMPFKIDDVIIINGKDYCFYQAPNEIKDEVNGLGLKNIHFSEDLNNCSGIKVCFGSNAGCEISIYGLCEGYNCDSKYDYGKVFNKGSQLYYYDGLLYGAIMSSPEIYECNLERLMKRFEELSIVYIEKIKIMELKGCSSNIQADLTNMIELSRDLESSKELFALSQLSETIDSKNNMAICKLY